MPNRFPRFPPIDCQPPDARTSDDAATNGRSPWLRAFDPWNAVEQTSRTGGRRSSRDQHRYGTFVVVARSAVAAEDDG